MATLLANKPQSIVATQWWRQHAREPLSVAWRRLSGTKAGYFHLQQLARVNRNDWAINRCKRGLGNDAWPSLHYSTTTSTTNCKRNLNRKKRGELKAVRVVLTTCQTDRATGWAVCPANPSIDIRALKSLLLKQPTLGVKRNFWPILVCQLFCFSEKGIRLAITFLMCVV